MRSIVRGFALTVSLATATVASAESAVPETGSASLSATTAASAATSVMIETDPATFALDGFAAHLRVVPGRAHVAVGVGVYALDFPSLLVDMNGSNRGEDWSVRLRYGVGGFADYYFKPDAEGWFVGGQLAAQNYRYSNGHVPGEVATATNLLLMPRAGFQWRPFDAGFYVMPWVGLGYTAQITGARTVGDRTYALAHFVPYAAVHVGWKF